MALLDRRSRRKAANAVFVTFCTGAAALASMMRPAQVP